MFRASPSATESQGMASVTRPVSPGPLSLLCPMTSLWQPPGSQKWLLQAAIAFFLCTLLISPNIRPVRTSYTQIRVYSDFIPPTPAPPRFPTVWGQLYFGSILNNQYGLKNCFFLAHLMGATQWVKQTITLGTEHK